jgi:hypothetical protein
VSQDPSSIFGYGVILKYHEYKYPYTGGDDSPGSPSAIYDSCQAYDGIRIVRIGSALVDEKLLLITVSQAYSASADYEPRALPPEKLDLKLSWDKRIRDYVKTWNLEEYLLDGFQEPAFIHAPYYG